MGAQGTVTVDFGAFPGNADTTVVVTGQAAITGSSLVEAWIYPVDTVDHSADEHIVDPPRVIAGGVVNATGFTIYAFAQAFAAGDGAANELIKGPVPGDTPRVYGLWTVAWVWN